MENNKEKWIDEVLNSTGGMSRAVPDNGLYEKVVARIKTRQTNIIPFPVKRWVAAAILLLALNIGSVIYFMSQNRGAYTASTDTPLAIELQSSSTYNY